MSPAKLRWLDNLDASKIDTEVYSVQSSGAEAKADAGLEPKLAPAGAGNAPDVDVQGTLPKNVGDKTSDAGLTAGVLRAVETTNGLPKVTGEVPGAVAPEQAGDTGEKSGDNKAAILELVEDVRKLNPDFGIPETGQLLDEQVEEFAKVANTPGKQLALEGLVRERSEESRKYNLIFGANLGATVSSQNAVEARINAHEASQLKIVRRWATELGAEQAKAAREANRRAVEQPGAAEVSSASDIKTAPQVPSVDVSPRAATERTVDTESEKREEIISSIEALSRRTDLDEAALQDKLTILLEAARESKALQKNTRARLGMGSTGTNESQGYSDRLKAAFPTLELNKPKSTVEPDKAVSVSKPEVIDNGAQTMADDFIVEANSLSVGIKGLQNIDDDGERINRLSEIAARAVASGLADEQLNSLEGVKTLRHPEDPALEALSRQFVGEMARVAEYVYGIKPWPETDSAEAQAGPEGAEGAGDDGAPAASPRDIQQRRRDTRRTKAKIIQNRSQDE